MESITENNNVLKTDGPAIWKTGFNIPLFFADKPFIFSFFAALAFLLLTFLFFSPHFQYNDDVQVLLLLKGVGLDQAPSALNARENILLCTLVKDLYLHFPRVQWYSCLLVFAQFLSLWATLAALQWGAYRGFRSLLFFFGFAGIGVYFFTNLQWTMTASLAALGAFFLGAALWKEKDRKPPAIAYLLVFFLVVLSVQIRHPSFFLIAVLSLPVAGALGRKKEITPARRSILLFLVLTFLAAFSAIGFNYIFYQRTPGWAPFIEFFDQHFELHETRDPVYDQDSKSLFDSIGWTANDLALFQDWYFMDEDIYSAGHLRALSQYFPKFNFDKPTNYFLAKKISFLTTQIVVYFFLAFLWLAPRGSLRLLGASALWTYLVLLFLMGYEKLPERVFLPALFFLTVLAVFYAVPKWENRPQCPKRFPSVVPAAVVLLVFLSLFTAYFFHQEYSRNRRWVECEGLMKTYMESFHPRSNQLYALWGSNFPYEFFGAFDDFEAYRSFNIIPLTWFQRSPTTRAMLDRFGVKDLFEDMVDNPNLFLVCTAEETNTYNIHMMEKYNIKTRLEAAFSCPFFTAYQVHLE